MENKIDFIIPWVDGSDPQWQADFQKHQKIYMPAEAINTEENANIADISAERYRDWGNLHYWFRGVEKFAPWVNKIHFITYGHLPEWLNTQHEKLHVVNHSDFIPDKYLPTFSSAPIELNMHRIEGLSERFVYFNDDMFLCRAVTPDRFFRNGLPRDMARLNIIRTERIEHNALECLKVINGRHDKRASISRNPSKWINFRYPASDILKTLMLLPWKGFTGFREHHSAQPYLRSTFETLWREESEALDTSSRSKFRTPTDLIQWVMHYEQLAAGNFIPHSYRDTRLYKLSEESVDGIAEDIIQQKYSIICLNDSNAISDYEAIKQKMNNAFDNILKEKSSFEK